MCVDDVVLSHLLILGTTSHSLVLWFFEAAGSWKLEGGRSSLFSHLSTLFSLLAGRLGDSGKVGLTCAVPPP